MVSEGKGRATVATKSQLLFGVACDHRSSRKPRITGRQRSARRGVKAGPTRARSRRCRSPVRFKMLASM